MSPCQHHPDHRASYALILSFRQKPPALVWYRRQAAGWDQFVIEKDYLTLEAGGAVCDIDRDGDLDVAFGGDWQSSEVWWWENPAPNRTRSIRRSSFRPATGRAG